MNRIISRAAVLTTRAPTPLKSLASQSPTRHQSSAPKKIAVFVDDQRIEVEPGISVLEACARAGVEIPRFCYHERLSVAGNCRMCLVEVEKSLKPVASCAMPVMPEMKIKTNSDMTRKAREGVMEFLLLNHPLDCPICDQGGECDLQDQSMAFGADRSRLKIHLDDKRGVEDKYIGPLVKTIMNRCIHCTRCVRFMNEIAGCDDLGTSGRGSDMQIGTYLESTALLSELSTNIVDICPVGALTSRPYTFTGRPWELRRIDSIDVMDAVGSNISVNQRSNDLLRIIPRVNEDINEEWLADKSRHAPVDGLKRQRLFNTLLRPSRKAQLEDCDWEDALISVTQALTSVRPDRLVAIVGPHTDAETMVAIKDLVNKMGSEHVYVHLDSDLDPTALPTSADNDFRANYLFNTGIANLESADLVLIVGANPRFEAPMVNARIRKSWRNHTTDTIGYVGPRDLDLLYDYEWLGDDTETVVQLAEGKHPFSKKFEKAKHPVLIVGQQVVSGGVHSNLYQAARWLANKQKLEMNVLHVTASQVAAFDLGLKPVNEWKIENNGEPAMLWLFGVDDPDLEVPKNCFVVYQGHTGEYGAEIADVVVPGVAFTEKQATYANLEGRAQQTLQAISPPAASREDWKIIRAVSEIANRTLPYDNLTNIRRRMAEIAPNLVDRNPTYRNEPKLKSPVEPTKVTQAKVKFSPRARSLLEYFQTDVISRQSPTMAKCVVEFKKEMDKRQDKARDEGQNLRTG